MCGWAEGKEVKIILKYNTLKQNKCELSRLAPIVPVLMLLPSFKLARASWFSATFMVSIYCWLLNHFTYPPSRYVTLFTVGIWFKDQLTKKHHSCLFITMCVNDSLILGSIGFLLFPHGAYGTEAHCIHQSGPTLN